MIAPREYTDPIALFTRWYAEAARAGIAKPNAMTLATVGRGGQASARVVLLSSYDDRGFVFHTNYESRKGVELAAHPWATLVFWWDPLGYQVRIEGPVERIAPAESDAYFAGRPRGSQLGAWASDQSRVISGREVLEARVRELELRYRDAPVPRPPHWGGYRLIPRVVEFWEDRADRLHDRVRYERAAEEPWRAARLAP